MRSRWLAPLAASLALILGAGGIMAYLGASRQIGPFASLGTSALSDSDYELANANANMVYRSINDYISFMISDGRVQELRSGTEIRAGKVVSFSLDLGKMTDEELKLMHDLKVLDREMPSNGEIAFFVDNRCKIEWAQWRAGEGSAVGQYPQPASAAAPVEFGEFGGTRSDSDTDSSFDPDLYVPAPEENSLPDIRNKSAEDDKIDASNFDMSVGIAFNGLYRDESSYIDEIEEPSFSKEEAVKWYEDFLRSDPLEVQPDNIRKVSPYLTLRLTVRDTLEQVTIQPSDSSNANVIVNGHYYRYSVPLFKESAMKAYFGKNNACVYILAPSWESGEDIAWRIYLSDDALEKLTEWYRGFKERQKRIMYTSTNTYDAVNIEDYFCIQLIVDDEAVEIASTKFVSANLQVNGMLYREEDTEIFDIVREMVREKSSIKVPETVKKDNYPDYAVKYEIYTDPMIRLSGQSIMGCDCSKDEIMEWYENFRNSKQTIVPLTMPKYYLPYVKITITDTATGDTTEIMSPDHPEADVIVNGVYYKCEVKPFIDPVLKGIFYDSDGGFYGTDGNWKDPEDTNEYTLDENVGFEIFNLTFDEETSEKAAEWYRKFKNEIPGFYYDEKYLEEDPEFNSYCCAVFDIDGETVEIASTKYKNAPIQVNGRYCAYDDTSILDIIRKGVLKNYIKS